MYAPVESVVHIRTSPVSVWIAVTFAPETTPPLASWTVPRMLPAISCAEALRIGQIAINKTHINLLKLHMKFSDFRSTRYRVAEAEQSAKRKDYLRNRPSKQTSPRVEVPHY
jgi:hypothetical protein